MTQEDKQLLLVDLCARLPYGVICKMEDKLIINDSPFYDYTLSERHIDLFRNHKDFYIKPYLRPMSSMTEEEVDEFTQFDIYAEGEYIISNYEMIGWLNAHHFDYHYVSGRGYLIDAGLALEAPNGMYD